MGFLSLIPSCDSILVSCFVERVSFTMQDEIPGPKVFVAGYFQRLKACFQLDCKKACQRNSTGPSEVSRILNLGWNTLLRALGALHRVFFCLLSRKCLALIWCLDKSLVLLVPNSHNDAYSGRSFGKGVVTLSGCNKPNKMMKSMKEPGAWSFLLWSSCCSRGLSCWWQESHKWIPEDGPRYQVLNLGSGSPLQGFQRLHQSVDLFLGCSHCVFPGRCYQEKGVGLIARSPARWWNPGFRGLTCRGAAHGARTACTPCDGGKKACKMKNPQDGRSEVL